MLRLLGEMKSSDLMNTPRSLDRIDPDLFEDFYVANWAVVYRTLAVVLRNSDLAREATDEAMVRAYQRWSTVRRYGNATGWVYRVGLNWARSRLRKTRREQFDVPEQVTQPDSPADPAVERALARLPFAQREVVVMHYLFDLSVPQIAGMLEIPEGTIKSRLHRALGRLREELPNES